MKKRTKPIYFRHRDGFSFAVFYCLMPDGTYKGSGADGTSEDGPKHWDKSDFGPNIASGRWIEITEAEAEKLLDPVKPEKVREIMGKDIDGEVIYKGDKVLMLPSPKWVTGANNEGITVVVQQTRMHPTGGLCTDNTGCMYIWPLKSCRKIKP